jgi:hypothetical protein
MRPDEVIGLATSLGSAQSSFRSGGLTYPADVGTMSRNSHYVQFFINENTAGTVSMPGGAIPSSNPEPAFGAITRRDTRRALGSITLYMPSQIQVSQKANYGEAEIGMVVAAALKTGQSLMGEAASDFDLGQFASTVGAQASNSVAAALEGAGATGAQAALAISTGRTTNNRTEMKFEGIDRRAFNFTFRLLPKSAAEAQRIQEIVTMFRLHSMPEFDRSDSLGRTLIAPSTFDIQYTPDEHLHKISTSVLESVDVKYGGDRPQFYKDNHPTETELTLTFKELDIVTKDKIAQGY